MPVHRYTILLAEDNTSMRNGIRDILELAGYHVLVAVDGENALALLADNAIDLVISDIMMPQMDGYQFYHAVRQVRHWNKIPFIFLTAKGERSDIRLGKQLGADDYLVKPFEPEDLLIVVESKLRRTQQFEELSNQAVTELKSSIIRTLSHEFRTPLTFIQGYSEMLELSGLDLDPASFQEFLRGIRRGSNRLNRMVEDFLLLVQLEAGQLDNASYESFEDIEIEFVISSAVANYEARAWDAGVSFHVNLTPSLVVHSSFLHVSNIIERLLDNAIKFSRGISSVVEVRSFQHNGYVQVDVIDYGVGIPEDEIPHLFNALQQIKRQKQEQQGAGLGLAIARGVASHLGGEIYVKSDIGKGSTFSLLLPAAQFNSDGE